MDDGSLPLGCDITREEVRALYGGPTQGGISPSKTSDRIMLFTGPSTETNELEGWGSDGCYHFMGLGASGDQVMKQGNRSLANHKQDGRQLHLFILAPDPGSPRLYRYVGRFELDPSNPHYKADAVGYDGAMRSVIIFRLRPVGKVSTYGPRLAVTPAQELTIQAAPLRLSREPVTRVMRPSTARTEGLLLQEYAHHLRSLGRDVSQMQINVAGEAGALVIDLLDKTENRLIEVKSSATRSAVRAAIGALMDYRRFLNPTPRLAVLVPDKPREDLLDLCASLCVEVIWRGENGGFVSSDD
ncbi:restriction endonuclease [Streptomyces sp. NPDC006430]|uniref:restriction endonuclease n=1 Tax=Streptomyces sp. NPDC006430 TaxID=3154299 RepID=UPI0033B3C4E9